MAATHRLRDTTVADRFNRNWMPVTESGCWIWLGTIADTGYGKMIAFGQPKASTHRVSYILHCGPIPLNSWVLHRCDVRLCVNPDHLFLGSAQDNSDDMIAKNRHRTKPSRGVENCNAKLDDAAVRHIRCSPLDGASLARKYGVTPRVIYLVRNDVTWRHVA